MRTKQNRTKKEIYLPNINIEKINKESYAKGISFSELVRRIIDEYYEVQQKETADT